MFFTSEFKLPCWNEGWGNLWLRQKGRGHVTLQPSVHTDKHSSKPSTCQKEFLSVSQSLFLSLHSSIRSSTHFPFMPLFFLIDYVLSLFPGTRVNSGSFGIVSLYLSTFVSTAPRNGDGTEVSLSVPFIFCFFPAASFLYLLYFIIPLSPLIHPFHRT